MNTEEMNRYVQFLFEQFQQKDAQHKEMMKQFAEIKEELKRANEIISSYTLEQQHLNALVLSLTEQLHEAQQIKADLERKREKLEVSLRDSRKHPK